MFCSACGQSVSEDARFCQHCGAQFQEEGEIATKEIAPEIAPYEEPYEEIESATATEPVLAPVRPGHQAARDPYKEQIAELRLYIKRLKLELRQITTDMANTRAQYNQTSAFIPRGILHKGYKLFEDARLLGPQQQKQRLQQEVLRLEQELLDLQQAQLDWREQHA
ncbi:MAG: zinc ribbon domain-containing protein [Ktedonobacteraceae bacterium]|nr:zinc ribbon domain-containing protein [Ktedonobacteraceae bacterium]